MVRCGLIGVLRAAQRTPAMRVRYRVTPGMSQKRASKRASVLAGCCWCVPSRVDIRVRSHSRPGGQPRFRRENGRMERAGSTGAEAGNAASLNGIGSRPWFQAVASRRENYREKISVGSSRCHAFSRSSGTKWDCMFRCTHLRSSFEPTYCSGRR
jgi:hypothetical protein